jgi:hypothetical protein
MNEIHVHFASQIIGKIQTCSTSYKYNEAQQELRVEPRLKTKDHI